MDNKFTRLLDSSVRNLSQAFYDQFVEVNASFRLKAGFMVTIVREELGDCCSWCADLAGTYSYDNAPKDVFARHANCKCIVITKTQKGTWQDAWSRKEYKSFRDNRIAREQEILVEENRSNIIDLKIGDNVTGEYLRKARPGRGKVLFEKGFAKDDYPDEVKTAEWLHKRFGGEIKLLNRSNEKKSPDYNWNGKLWDLKTVSTEKAANSAIRSGIHQIEEKPGGVILNYDPNKKINFEMLESTIKKRMEWYPDTKADIMVRQGNKFAIIRFGK